MTDKDKARIRIHIAGEPILLTVPFDRQDAVRDAENEVNSLFETWRRRFPEKSDMELLAMVAFQFASHYADLRVLMEDARDRIDRAGNRLDSLLQPASSGDDLLSELFP